MSCEPVTSDIISIFFWNSEEWPFHFCLQVHAFHKCDSLWSETDNLCIIHDCHTSCDQWSFMEFFQINDLLALMIFEVLGLQCFLLGTLIQLTDFKLMISLGLGCELRSWCYVFVVLFSSTSCLFVLDYKQSCTLTGTSSAIPSVCRTEESANCNCMGVGVNIE